MHFVNLPSMEWAAVLVAIVAMRATVKYAPPHRSPGVGSGGAMTGIASGGPNVRAGPERRSARMVLDLGVALGWPVVDVLRAELDQGVEVHVVLLGPRLG
jgi:hypothetical protein